MKAKHFLFIVLATSIIYFSYSGCRIKPDIVLFRFNDYSFGFNYTEDAGIKILLFIMIIITGVLLSGKKQEENSEE